MRIDKALLASFPFEPISDAPNPMPIKAKLRILGLPAGECRPSVSPILDGLEA